MKLYKVWYRDSLTNRLYAYPVKADTPEQAIQRIYTDVDIRVRKIEFIRLIYS